MILVFDDVLPDVEAYRQAALAQVFASLELAPGLTFHGIAAVPDPVLLDWIHTRWPELQPTLTFFRQSPAGQREPNYIHTDRDMGDWTAILYLTPHPPPGDGTTFWRHKVTGAVESLTNDSKALVDEQLAWRDDTQWEPALAVPARFGRVVVFPAARFHSRAILDNYGDGDDARLIQVVFGQGRVPSWQ